MIDIIHSLRRARGTNAKKAILETHKDNDLWKRFLVAAYDPHVNYYIAAVNDTTFIDDCDVESMLNELAWLSDRIVTGNDARDHARYMSEEYGELFRLVLSGNIKAGVNVKTINNVYGNLIPTFPVMLGVDIPVPRFPVWASTKFDGARVLVRVMDKKATVYTRSGKRLHLRSLENDMKDQMPGMYDGELIYQTGKMVGRTKIVGQVNRVLRGGQRDIKNYCYMIFDAVDIGSWDDRHDLVDYGKRYRLLQNTLRLSERVQLIEQVECPGPELVNALFEDRLEVGFEGLILRYPEDYYEWKRTHALIKKKAIKEFVLECYDTQPGTGKYEGLIGALLCRGTVEGTYVEVKVGSGFSDFDRDLVPEYYVGAKIEGLYNSIVKSENSEHYSLFLPRFKRVVGAV